MADATMCPVCFDLTPDVLPGCGHTLCHLCAAAWFDEHRGRGCPICRAPVERFRRGREEEEEEGEDGGGAAARVARWDEWEAFAAAEHAVADGGGVLHWWRGFAADADAASSAVAPTLATRRLRLTAIPSNDDFPATARFLLLVSSNPVPSTATVLRRMRRPPGVGLPRGW